MRSTCFGVRTLQVEGDDILFKTASVREYMFRMTVLRRSSKGESPEATHSPRSHGQPPSPTTDMPCQRAVPENCQKSSLNRTDSCGLDITRKVFNSPAHQLVGLLLTTAFAALSLIADRCMIPWNVITNCIQGFWVTLQNIMGSEFLVSQFPETEQTT